VFTATHDSI